MAVICYPFSANASLFSFVTDLFGTSSASVSDVNVNPTNSQTISLLKAAVNIDPNPTKIELVPTIVDNSSLMAEVDPLLSSTSPILFDNFQIVTYVVRSGDTLAQIAKTFSVTEKTIMVANDMTSQKLTEGQRLIILPVSGIQHTVKAGQTIDSIAKMYKLKTQDILEYNYFENSSKLAVGDKIFVPSDALPASRSTSPSKSSTARTSPILNAPLFGVSSTKFVDDTGYFIEPLVNYHKTQGLHGHNGVDLGASVGEPILAAASGEVIISRTGWNGGYGNYVVIQHNNGTQTLYSHASKLLVTEGQSVTKGQKIALVGSTGRSTGPHLHVEVRGSKNPF